MVSHWRPGQSAAVQQVPLRHWPLQQTLPLPHCWFVVQGEHRWLRQTGFAGSVHSAVAQQSPETHLPLQQSCPAGQGCAASQAGQHFVPVLQPLLLMLPFGIVVRQNFAPEVLAPLRLAPLRSASIRQALLRLARVKLAPLASAPLRLAPLRLQLLQLTFSRAVEPLKSQLAR